MANIAEGNSLQSPAHKIHYDFMMNQYSQRLVGPNFETSMLTTWLNIYLAAKGMIFPLADDGQLGDFATYSDFTWSRDHKRTWSTSKSPPIQSADIPANTIFTTYTFHDPGIRTANNDIRIAKADFERLVGTPRSMASNWILSRDYVALFPNGAIAFTEEQRQAYRNGTIHENGENAPTISDCIQPGFRVTDMVGNTIGVKLMRPIVVTAAEVEQAVRHGY